MKYILSAFLFLFSLNSHAWTSIAYSPSKNVYSIATQYMSDAPAQKASIASCNQKANTMDCKVVWSLSGKNLMFGVALGDNGIGVTFGTDIDELVTSTLDKCKLTTVNCKITDIVWDGSGTFATQAYVNNRPVKFTTMMDSDMARAMQLSIDICKSTSESPDLCIAVPVKPGQYYAGATPINKTVLFPQRAIGDTLAAAESTAIEECMQMNQLECKIDFSGQIKPVFNPMPDGLKKRIEAYKSNKKVVMK